MLKKFDIKNHNLLLMITYIIPLFWFGILTTGDQKVYINTAMEMWERSEWLTPYLFNEPSFIKPPFQYWATLLSWNIFGFNTFATYLAPVIGLLVTVFFLNQISTLLNEKIKIKAGTLFAVTIGAWTYAFSPQTEVYLVMLGCGAWWAGLKYLKYNQACFLYLALFFAGLLSLVKTPAHSAFWVMGFTLYLLLTRQLNPFKTIHFYLSHLLGVGVGIIWYLYAYFFHFDAFMLQYVQQEHLARMYLIHGSVSGIWFSLLAFALPFVFFLFSFLLQAFSKFRKDLLALVFSWSVFPALVFSYFYYRVNTYLFVLLPAFCVGMGEMISSGTFYFKRFSYLITGLIVLLTGSFVFILFIRLQWISAWILIPLLVVSIVFMFFAFRMNFSKMVIAQIGVLFFLRLCMVSLGEADISSLKKVHQSFPDQEFSILVSKDVWNESGILSVVISKPIERLYDETLVVESLQNRKVVIIDEAQKESVEKLISNHLSHQKITWTEWKRWQKRRFFPLKEILRFEPLTNELLDQTKRKFYLLSLS